MDRSRTAEGCGDHGIDWDLVVIGAGPAGSLTALLAARRGLRVLLVEKKEFPRDKVCGGCLNGRALAVLDRAGLLEPLSALQGVWIDRFQFRSRGTWLTVPLAGGVAVSRSRLDQLLVDAAVTAGAVFREQTQGTVLDSEVATNRKVELQTGTAAPVVIWAGVVVAADGLGHRCLRMLSGFPSQVHRRSHIGLAARTGLPSSQSAPPHGLIAMASGRGGYVGLVRDESETVHLAAAVSPDALRHSGGPAECVKRILCDARSELDVNLEQLEWQGTGPLTQHSVRIADRRLFVVGDAVGYVEPFTGEGIAWALAGAERLAPLIGEAAAHWRDDLAKRWQQELHAERRWTCRVLAAALRMPRLSSAVAWGLGKLPRLAAGIARTLDPHPEETRRRSAWFVRPGESESRPSVVDGPAKKDAA